MIRKTTLALLALALISSITAGYLILRPDPVNESERYRDDVTILGHQRVRIDSLRGANAFFIGEELSDIEVQFSVFAPKVRWFHEEASFGGDLSLVAEGYGSLDGVRCFVKVARIRSDAAARTVGAQHLTADQITGLAGGRLEAIKVAVLCDPQDDALRSTTGSEDPSRSLNSRTPSSRTPSSTAGAGQ